MKDKWLIVFFASLCSFQSLSAFEGFYVGTSLGASVTKAEQNGFSLAGYTPVFLDVDYLNNFSQTLIDHSFVGALYAGYGLFWYQIYLGLEGLCSLILRNSPIMRR